MRKFKIGDRIRDQRDGEICDVVEYYSEGYKLRVVRIASGSVGTGVDVGEIYRNGVQTVDSNCHLEESYRVQLILNRYEV